MHTIGIEPRARPGFRGIEILGVEPAFGFECQRRRVSPQQVETCDFPVEATCSARHVLQHVDRKHVLGPNGPILHEGRTTFFEAGPRGTVVKPGDIVLP